MILKYKDFVDRCIPPLSIQEPKNTSRVQMVDGTRVRRVPKGFRTARLTITYNQALLSSFWVFWTALNNGADSFELEIRLYGHIQPYEVRFIQAPSIRELGAGNYSLSTSIEIIDDKKGSTTGCPLFPSNTLYPSNALYPC